MIILFFSRRKSPAHETIEKNYQNWNPKEIRNPKIDTATEPAQQQIRAGGESSFEGEFQYKSKSFEKIEETTMASGMFFFRKIIQPPMRSSIVGVTSVRRTLDVFSIKCEVRHLRSITATRNGTYLAETFKRQSEPWIERLSLTMMRRRSSNGTQCQAECGEVLIKPHRSIDQNGFEIFDGEKKTSQFSVSPSACSRPSSQTLSVAVLFSLGAKHKKLQLASHRKRGQGDVLTSSSHWSKKKNCSMPSKIEKNVQKWF